MKDQEKSAKIVAKFFISPKNKASFDPFFALSLNITKRYLSHLKRRGFTFSNSYITDEHSLENLAYDILGYFMASKCNNPFYIIYKYFRKTGITDFQNRDPLVLFGHYLRLLKGFIHQQLTKLNKEEDPQRENLKRRFKEILNESEFEEILIKEKSVHYCLIRQKDNLRNDQPYIDIESLEQIILEAFNKSKNRREWCHSIFKKLAEFENFQNLIKKSDLLILVVKINYQFLYDPDNYFTKSTSIEGLVLQHAVKNAIEFTLNAVQQNCISTYIGKNKVSKDGGKNILKACNDLLEDFGASGEYDSFPTYFLEFYPSVSQADYQKKYKNVCDTVFRKALDIFKDKLKNDSTI